MNLIIGHTMGTPEYSVMEALQLFKEIGFDGAELIYQKDYKCGISDDTNRDELERIRDFCKQNDFRILALTPYANLINSQSTHEWLGAVEELENCIKVAGSLDARSIRVYGGRYIQGKDSQWGEKEEILVATMKRLGNFASKFNIVLAIETHFGTMAHSAMVSAELYDRIGHDNVGILYDQSNLTFQGEEEYEEAIRLLAGKIAYVHVKDLVFRGEDRSFIASEVAKVKAEERKVRSRIPGEGVIPWKRIIQMLRTNHYRGDYSLEYERRWHPDDIPDARIGMKRGEEFIRALIKEIYRDTDAK